MTRQVAVVAHTHWDREWYSPFEFYRERLVAVIDELLDLLESDLSFHQFHLDGQMALIDDYLAVRPGQSERLHRLVESGRITVGPWYVLMDEFCVSGETIVRNLQLGLQRSRSLGRSGPIGYLPDMFGHVAQMPHLLRQAGIDRAVVWRGVPRAVDASAFWWESPGGDRVRAEYLPVGYANGAFLPKHPDDFIRRVAAHENEIGAFLRPDWPLLLMNGGDHQHPQPWMPELLEEANRSQDRYRFRQASLDEFVPDVPEEGLPVWRGELRSSARACLLMGVLSNRVDVKQAAARTERALEKLAEPLAALWLPPDMWPAARFDEAWLAAIRNSAHDSICACSVDEVGRSVMHRYDSATTLASGVTAQALSIAAVATSQTGPVVVNSSARSRSGVVETTVPGDEVGRWLSRPVQAMSVEKAGSTERTGRGGDLARILGELAAEGWLGETGRGVDAAVEDGEGGLGILLVQDESRPPKPEMAAVMAEAWARAGAGRDRPLTVSVDRRPSTRLAVLTGVVPGFGWALLAPEGVAQGSTPRARQGEPERHLVRIHAGRMRNGLIDVQVDQSTGTFAIGSQGGLGAIVDEADDGDTYNFSPLPADVPIRQPIEVRIIAGSAGPLIGRLSVVRTYEWPARISAGRREDRESVDVLTELELRAGEAFVRVAITFENRARDHRVRAVFPLPQRAAVSVAECAFGTVTRGLETEGGPHEYPLPTFPSRRFVSAGGMTVIHEGLLEYELVDGGTALAITLVRCVGTLSKPAPTYRPNVAGPALPLEDTQVQGPVTARLAVGVGGDPWAMADDTWVPLQVVAGTGGGPLPESGSRLRIGLDGSQVSALRRQEGHLEVRLFNPSDRTSVIEIPGHRGRIVDLRGEPVINFDGRFEVGAHRIVTARLDATSLD